MSDEERTRLAREAVSGDLAAARRLVRALERDQPLVVELEPLDPNTPLNEVDHEAAGFNASWWGQVKRFARAWSHWPNTPNPPTTLRHLAKALTGYEKDHAPLHGTGPIRKKILALLTRAGLPHPPPFNGRWCRAVGHTTLHFARVRYNRDGGDWYLSYACGWGVRSHERPITDRYVADKKCARCLKVVQDA